MYLTYEEYREMGGKLTESAFDGIINEVFARIDYYTMNRLKGDTNINDKVRMCCFSLCDCITTENAIKDTDNQVVASESNDGVSKTYAVMQVTERQNFLEGKEALKIIRRYLAFEENEAGERLLYRGV